MLIKNKILSIYSVTREHFFVSFILSASLIFALISISTLQVRFINSNVWFTIGFILSLIVISIFYDICSNHRKLKPYVRRAVSYVFLVSLIALVIGDFSFLVYPDIKGHVFLISLISGFLTFFRSVKEKTSSTKEIEPREDSKFVDNRTTNLQKTTLAIIVLVSCCIYLYGMGSYGFQMDELYHAWVVRNFLSKGMVFYYDNVPYTRSILTSIIGIISASFFKLLNLNLSREFILRLPMAMFGIFNILLTFKISKKIFKNKSALLASLFVGTETYLVYFSTYFRFYVESISLILLGIYLIILYPKSLVLKLSITSISFFLYFTLSEYFLLVTLFFGLLSAYDIYVMLRNKNGKIQKSTVIAFFVVILAIILGTIYVFLDRLNSKATYNLVSWSLDVDNIKLMWNWLFTNYSFFISVFATSLIIPIVLFKQSKKIDRENILELYIVVNVLFLFGFLLNVPHNFTFRVTLFFLPVLFIICFKYINETYFKTKLVYLPLILLILITIFSTSKFHISKIGDSYYPTKLVYEKMPAVSANDEIAKFVLNLIENNNIKKLSIAYLGHGGDHLKYYLEEPDLEFKITTFRYSRTGNSTLESFKQYASENQENTLIVIVSKNAQITPDNYLYQTVFGVPFVTEVDTKISDYVMQDDHFKKVYTSQDDYSAVYVKSGSVIGANVDKAK